MKPKILFIFHTPPPVHGSSVVGQYIKESLLINQSFDCSFVNLGTSRTVDEIGRKPLQKLGRYLSIISQVLKQLLSNKPHLCYIAISAKGTAFYKDAVIALIVRLFGTKLVFHFHNKGVSSCQNKALDHFLYQRVFKNTYAILLSKYMYPDLEKYFTPERVHYCPNGIPDIDFRIKTLDKKQNEIVEILFLSNLIESKGVFVLLEACKILKQKGITYQCTFVGGEGDVNAQQFQEKVNELGLTDQVVYAGKKYGKEKEEAFLNADIFVFPTYLETFGLVNLEAMQHALPIISTYEGGIPDVIENGVTGFLVRQKDMEALANKIEILIKNSELRGKMGSAGRKRYEQKFTFAVFELRLKEILLKVLA